MKRGDVAVVDFAPTNPGAGLRPAPVVQNDRDNARMRNTIVAQITSNVRRAGADTQLLIDADHPDRASSGLRLDSAVNCSNLATIQQGDVTRAIGALSSTAMLRIDGCLRAALGIS